MKAKLALKLGNKNITVEGDGTPQEVIKNLSFWSTLPSVCGLCKSVNIGLSHRQTKDENDYYGLKCLDCTADFTFHQLKKGGFYITPTDVWSIWDGGSKSAKNPEPANDDEPPPF